MLCPCCLKSGAQIRLDDSNTWCARGHCFKPTEQHGQPMLEVVKSPDTLSFVGEQFPIPKPATPKAPVSPSDVKRERDR